jgi:endonuclease YncB( thermonuclease family)
MKTDSHLHLQRLGLGALVFFLLAAGFASAQEMPAPRSSPRVPVNRQALGESAAPVPHSRDVTGPATIIDGEHLRVGDMDLRLFGIVPPQLSASFGPQARAALDEVTQGQPVECHIRDRDHDGRFLATCVTQNTKIDLALELLKRGLAVTARGSLQPTEFAAPYETAEQAAETQKIGLWSVAPPAPVTLPASPPAAAANPNVPPLPSELKKEPAKPSTPAPVITASPPVAAMSAATHADKTPLPLPVFISGAPNEEGSGVSGFFARYQLLLTGLVILATALGIALVLALERRKDRRDEIKAIAAALRGELQAARAVCQARLKTWTEDDERGLAWPRIRATLYQAYVGRLGWLGATLARQIASIYGQAADYAAYFNPASNMTEPRETITKFQALQTLVQHIEEVLPKLAFVEQTGNPPKSVYAPKLSSPISAPVAYSKAAIPASTSYGLPPAVSATIVSLWAAVRKFAWGVVPEQKPVAEEPMPDYTALIEEEIARMTAEEEGASSSSPPNVTRIHGRGG